MEKVREDLLELEPVDEDVIRPTEEDEWKDLQEWGDGVVRHRFARDKEILRSGLTGLVAWPPRPER